MGLSDTRPRISMPGQKWAIVCIREISMRMLIKGRTAVARPSKEGEVTPRLCSGSYFFPENSYMQNSIVLDPADIEVLKQYLQRVRDIKGLRLCLYIMFMRYHMETAGSFNGFDDELDGDFYQDFANLLEVLIVLTPGPKDREITHF